MSPPTVPLGRLAEVRVSNVDKKTAEGERPVRLCNYTDVYYSDVIRDDRVFMAATATAAQVERFRLKAGDTLITKDSETAEDIAAASYVAGSARDLLCGYHLAIIRPYDGAVEPRFLAWATRSDFLREQLAAEATGVTRFGLRYDTILRARVPTPPPEIQRRVANFLDDQVARINEIIRLREAQAEAIGRRSTAAIDAVVTGSGLQSVSESQWRPFREVPRGWSETRLRRLRCLVQTGPFGSQLHSDEYIGVGGWPVVNPAGIAEDGLRAVPGMSIPGEVRTRLARHVLRAGDIVFGRRGDLGRAGIVTEAESGWVCGTGSLLVRLSDPRLRPEYLVRLLRARALKSYFEMQSVGSTMDNLNTEILLGMPLFVPPVDVQQDITSEADRIDENRFALTAEMTLQVELLRERKRSLITAAVTGEFDVSAASGRGVA